MNRCHRRYSLHHGHRTRLKRRFIHSGGENFNDHEILELLLYYSIPRKNTNDVAHKLLNEFGNFENILNASIEEIAEVEGVGEYSAVLIKLVTALSQRKPFSNEATFKRLTTLEQATLCARQIFTACKKEVMYAMLMDDAMNVRKMVRVCSGTDNEIRPLVRDLIEKAVKSCATTVIIFHNHPSASAVASQSDVGFTTLLYRELKIVGIDLIEHLIIADNDCEALVKTMRNQGLLPARSDLDEFYNFPQKKNNN